MLLSYNNQIWKEKGSVIPVCDNTLGNFLLMLQIMTELNDKNLPSDC